MKQNDLPTFTLLEVAAITGVDKASLIAFIEHEWICPCQGREVLDEEDLARIRLIQQLKHNFGVNDEAIPLLLHLLDQVYYYRFQLLDKTQRPRI
jgi:chaperone modulatory protein CbpM